LRLEQYCLCLANRGREFGYRHDDDEAAEDHAATIKEIFKGKESESGERASLITSNKKSSRLQHAKKAKSRWSIILHRRRAHLLLVFVAIVCFELPYYVFHFFLVHTSNAASGGKEDEIKVQTQWFLTGLAVCFFLCFPFAAPLHLGLGVHGGSIRTGAEQETTTALFQNGLVEALCADSTTCRIVDSFAMAAVVAMAGDYGSFHPPYPLMIPVYASFMIVNYATTYGAMLLLTVSMRAFLIRLFHVEKEIAAVLSETTAEDNNSVPKTGTSRDASCSGLSLRAGSEELSSAEITAYHERWVQSYEDVRHDLHKLAGGGFGILIELALLTIAIATTMLIAGIWEKFRHDFAPGQGACVVAAYSASAFAIVVSFKTFGGSKNGFPI